MQTVNNIQCSCYCHLQEACSAGMKIGKDEILKENNFVFILIVSMLHKRVDPVASKRKVPMKKRKMTESHGVLMTSVEVLDQAIPEHCPGHLCYIKKKEEEEEERESRDPAGRLDCHELGDSSKHLIFHECSNVVSSFPLGIGSGSHWGFNRQIQTNTRTAQGCSAI